MIHKCDCSYIRIIRSAFADIQKHLTSFNLCGFEAMTITLELYSIQFLPHLVVLPSFALRAVDPPAIKALAASDYVPVSLATRMLYFASTKKFLYLLLSKMRTALHSSFLSISCQVVASLLSRWSSDETFKYNVKYLSMSGPLYIFEVNRTYCRWMNNIIIVQEQMTLLSRRVDSLSHRDLLDLYEKAARTTCKNDSFFIWRKLTTF